MESSEEPLVVRSEISIARWLSRVPSVDECRPSRCPRCRCATYATEGQVQLHGHGFRQRVLMCMQNARREPERVVVRARRFLCRQCNAACLVVPSGVLAYRRYTGPSIGALIAREVEVMDDLLGSHGPRRPRTVRRWVRRTAAHTWEWHSPDERLSRLGDLIAAPAAHHVVGGLAEAAFLAALTCVDREHSIKVCLLPAHQLGAVASISPRYPAKQSHASTYANGYTASRRRSWSARIRTARSLSTSGTAARSCKNSSPAGDPRSFRKAPN